MSLKELKLGSVGPLLYESDNFDGVESPTIKLTEAPTENYHATRVQDAESIATTVSTTIAAMYNRHSSIRISNGVAVDSIKVQIVSIFNADEVTETEVAKGTTSGVFSLSAGGDILTIDVAAFAITPIDVYAVVSSNMSGTNIIVEATISVGSIVLTFLRDDASIADLSLLVDVGQIRIELIYAAV